MAFAIKDNNANEKVTTEAKLPVEAFVQVIDTLSFLDEKAEATQLKSVCYSAASNLAYALQAVESADSEDYIAKMENNLTSAKSYLKWAMSDGKSIYLPSNEQLNQIEIKKFGSPTAGKTVDDLTSAVELNIQKFAREVDTPYLDIKDMPGTVAGLPAALKKIIFKTRDELHESRLTTTASLCTKFEKSVDKCIDEASQGSINDVDTVSLKKFADWIVNDVESNVEYCAKQARIATKDSTKFWSKLAAKNSDAAKRLNKIINKHSQVLGNVTTDDTIDHLARA